MTVQGDSHTTIPPWCQRR